MSPRRKSGSGGAEFNQHFLGGLAVPGFALWSCSHVKRLNHSFTLRSRSALMITETELKLIAAPATIGLSSTPKNG